MTESNTTLWTGVRRLGRSDLAVSALGLGGWAIGGAMAAGDQPLGYANTDDQRSREGIRRGVELGVTLFDTADAYGTGHSEQLLGEELQYEPDVLIATKFGNTIDEKNRQLTGVDVTPGYVRTAVRASLRRLRRERIDLYQLHHDDVTQGQAEDLTEVLEDLATEGAIAWWGVSTDNAVTASWFAGAPRCTAIQFALNVLQDNSAVLEVCDNYDLAALCRSPLAMGLLGGKYNSASTLPVDDVRGRQPQWLTWFRDGRPDTTSLAAIDAVRGTLMTQGRTLAQGSLAWVWARHHRTIPLPGFRNQSQVEDNAGALRLGPLHSDEFTAIESALQRDHGSLPGR